MRIYYVIPPKGVRFRSQADAQAAFEAGQVWYCTGVAEVNDDGQIAGISHADPWRPARYSECHRYGDGDDVISVPKTWAMQWAPGRVSLLRYRVMHGQRKVSHQYGTGRQVALLEERTTDGGERYADPTGVRLDRVKLQQELSTEGGWGTSSGLRFRYTPDLHWVRRLSERRRAPVHFDPDLQCHTPGDRELERYFTSAAYRAHNQYARRLQGAVSGGGFNSQEGDAIAVPAPDSDHLTDTAVRPSLDKTGYIIG